jgi:hypothetical protein
MVITRLSRIFTKLACGMLFTVGLHCPSNNFPDMCCRLANLCSDWWQATPELKQLSVFAYVFGKPLRGTFVKLAKSTIK